MSYPQVNTECYADTVLVEILGFYKPTHHLGIGKVVNMFEKSLKNTRAVGIIDDDKVKPKALDNYDLVDEKEGIKRLSKNNHFILAISPAFEDWVFENANSVDVDPANYGFHTRKRFREVCKSPTAGANKELKRFLNDLKQKKVKGFGQLQTWICEGADIDKRDLYK